MLWRLERKLAFRLADTGASTRPTLSWMMVVCVLGVRRVVHGKHGLLGNDRWQFGHSSLGHDASSAAGLTSFGHSPERGARGGDVLGGGAGFANVMVQPQESNLSSVLDDEPDEAPCDDEKAFTPFDAVDAVVVLLGVRVEEPSAGPDNGDAVSDNRGDRERPVRGADEKGLTTGTRREHGEETGERLSEVDHTDDLGIGKRDGAGAGVVFTVEKGLREPVFLVGSFETDHQDENVLNGRDGSHQDGLQDHFEFEPLGRRGRRDNVIVGKGKHRAVIKDGNPDKSHDGDHKRLGHVVGRAARDVVHSSVLFVEFFVREV